MKWQSETGGTTNDKLLAMLLIRMWF